MLFGFNKTVQRRITLSQRDHTFYISNEEHTFFDLKINYTEKVHLAIIQIIT
jgi:hypothetical protein